MPPLFTTVATPPAAAMFAPEVVIILPSIRMGRLFSSTVTMAVTPPPAPAPGFPPPAASGYGENMNCGEMPWPRDGSVRSPSCWLMNSFTFTPDDGTSS